MEKSLLRRWDWLSGWLFFMLIQVAAARLVTTDWTKYLYFAETLAALGTFLGLALGASQYTRRIVIWFVIDYTLLVVPWQITNAADINLTL